MAKKKPISLLRQQWNKEVKRLQRFIKNAEKRGFTFSDKVIPPTPKRVTKKAVERLQNTKPSNLYSKAKYKTETGRIIKGTEGRALERKAAAIKGAFTKKSKAYDEASKQKKAVAKSNKQKQKSPSKPMQEPPKTEQAELPKAVDNILNNVRELIKSWSPSPNWADYYSDIKRNDKNLLERMLEAQVKQEGEDVIAGRLEAHATEVISLVNDILYGSGGKDGRNTQRDFARFTEILYGRPMNNEESIALAEAQEYSEDNEVI